MSYTTKLNLNEFEYTKLDQDDTQKFIMSIVRLMDSVFETNANDFELFAGENTELLEDEPLEFFNKCFTALEGAKLTKYQTQFNNFAQVNITTIFKWYRKNRECVNVSPKQLEWFKKWFVKHNVGHEFLLEQTPGYTRAVTPNFKGL